MLIVEDNADMWFATHAKSKKVSEITDNNACSISLFSNGKVFHGEGSAVLNNDMAKKQELWTEHWAQYFGSVDNPDLLLIKVTFDEIEYVDMSEGDNC